MRLIDADAAVKEIDDALRRVFKEQVGEGIISRVPTVDAVPVRHGRWIEDPDDDWGCRCSECGHLELYQFDYCSSCGARMDGKDGEQA